MCSKGQSLTAGQSLKEPGNSRKATGKMSEFIQVKAYQLP